MRIFQKGFNYSQDGPGNRLVYHVSGCNMLCLWCANPEGMKVSPDHRDYSSEEIVKEAQSAQLLFFDGGGVTFTGGEATLYKEELVTVLKALKEKGIHTAIETNGTSAGLSEILKYTDYLIMDFKHFDDEIMKKYTGVDTVQVKKNFEMICSSGRQCHIRIPLINEFNGSNPLSFAEYFSQFNTENVVFEFLRYHEYGKAKWTGEYRITDGFVSEETVNEFEKVFKEHGLKTVKS